MHLGNIKIKYLNAFNLYQVKIFAGIRLLLSV